MAQTKFFSYGELDFIKQGEEISGSVASGDDGVANRVVAKVAKNSIFLKERFESLDNIGNDVMILNTATNLTSNCNHLLKAGGNYALPDSAGVGSYVNAKSSGVDCNITTTTQFLNGSKTIPLLKNQSVQLVKTTSGWNFARVSFGDGWTKPQADDRYLIKQVFEIANSTSSENWYLIATGTGNLSARFQLESNVGNGHRNVVVYAGVSYGLSPTLNVVSNCGFGNSGFNELRLCNEVNVEQIYSRKYLAVRVKPGASVRVTMEKLQGKFDRWELSNGTVGASSTVINSYDCAVDLLNTRISTTSRFDAYGVYDAGSRVFSSQNKVPWDDNSISNRPQVYRGTTGSYGTVQVNDFKNGWAGYSIGGRACFMLSTDNLTYGLHRNNSWLIRSGSDDVAIISSRGRDALVCYDSHLEVKTASGSVQIGAMNVSHCHIYTDRPSFYFNKPIDSASHISVKTGYFDGDLVMNASGIRRHLIANVGSRNIHWYADPNTARWRSDVEIYCDGNGNFNDVYIRSDKSLKKHFIPLTNSLAGVMRILPYEYDKRCPDSELYNTHEEGFVAQDWEKEFPNAVHTDPVTGLKSLKPYAMIARLFNAVQELAVKVESLELKLREGT